MTTAHQHRSALRIPVLDGSGREVLGYRAADSPAQEPVSLDSACETLANGSAKAREIGDPFADLAASAIDVVLARLRELEAERSRIRSIISKSLSMLHPSVELPQDLSMRDMVLQALALMRSSGLDAGARGALAGIYSLDPDAGSSPMAPPVTVSIVRGLRALTENADIKWNGPATVDGYPLGPSDVRAAMEWVASLSLGDR